MAAWKPDGAHMLTRSHPRAHAHEFTSSAATALVGVRPGTVPAP